MLYNKLKNNKGQTIVETAISIILLFLLVFGITEFGRAMYIKNMLNSSARAAARAAVVTRPLNDLDYAAGSFSSRNNSNPPDVIQQKIYDGLFYVDKALVSATVRVKDASGNLSNPANGGDTVTVQLTLTGFKSFVPNLIRMGDPSTGINLIGSASMRYE